MADEHRHHINAYVLGTAALAGGIILAPYVLPAVGVGSEEMAENAIAALCGTGEGTGLAGGINAMLSHVPVIGESLAQGGWTNVGVIATLGIGGHLLANHMDKNQESGIPWGKVVRYAALATSMLVALPSILTGVSAGLVFLAASVGGAELGSAALTHLSSTLGTTGENAVLATSGAGLTASAAHLLTCGLSLAPATIPFLLSREQSKPTELYLDATTAQPLSPGQPNTIFLRLADKEGRPVTPEQLAVVHEKKLHVFVTDSGLSEYHHIHPEPTHQPGIYTVPFSPQSSGSFRLWAEATPTDTMRGHVLQACLPSLSAPSAPFDFRPNRQAMGNGLQFSWSASPPLRKGEGSLVTVNVTDPQGAPVPLEPLLGASAHLVGFSGDGKHCLHTHPLGGADGIPPLRFHVTPEHDGPTRFFLQVKHQGQELTTSFDQAVFPSKTQTQGFAAAHEGQTTHPSASLSL